MSTVNWYAVDMRLVPLAAAIAQMEGWFHCNSIAFKHHNPGNIEASHGVYETYDSAADGWQALLVDISDNAGKTLRQFITKYAPPEENDTTNYLAIVSGLSGIGPDEVL